jgi:hypothetical protein
VIDTITAIVFLAVWPLWLAWELVLLRLRATAEGQPPKTISMVARDIGWKSSCLVYLWAGLAAHYWWTGAAWGTVAGGIAFWLIAVALLVEDAILWRSPRDTWPLWLYWQRLPALWLALGLAAGRLLFPQAES